MVAFTAADPAAPPRRVVVTGQGVVTSLGHEPEEFYNNLLAGKSGISLIESFNTGARRPAAGQRRGACCVMPAAAA